VVIPKFPDLSLAYLACNIYILAAADYAFSLQFYALQNNTDRRPVVLAQL
jgi:hypothetical protein